MIDLRGFAGCCAATELFNMGGAHSVQTAKDQKTFDDICRRRIGQCSSVLITTLNGYQTKTKSYLLKQGWEFKTIGHIHVGTIARSRLDTYLKSAVYEKEKPKESRFALGISVSTKKTSARKTNHTPFTLARLRVLLHASPNRSGYTFLSTLLPVNNAARMGVRDRINRELGINLQGDLLHIGCGELQSLHRAIVYQLARKELEKE